MRKGIELSVIIPAYNEVARLPHFLLRVERYLHARYPNAYEIIVVDDGSTDGTADAARRCLRRGVVERLAKNVGKGAAVRHGMLVAQGEMRLFLDADGATPIDEEQRLVIAVRGGHDIAIGSRSTDNGRRRFLVGNGTPPNLSLAPNGARPVWRVRPHRHIAGRVFATLVRWILGLPFADTQCGCKLFTADAAEAIFGRAKTDRFAFDVEALYLAKILGMRVAEVGVNWHEVAGSKVRIWRDALPMYLELTRIAARHGDEAKRQARRVA